MQGEQTRIQTVALVSSYVPRRCGIATFAKDLRDAMASDLGDRQVFAVAMDDLPGGYQYSQEVRFQVPDQVQEAYRTAADMLNINQVDITVVQHEFGIYGGQDGSYLLDLIRRRMLLKTHSIRRGLLRTLCIGLNRFIKFVSHVSFASLTTSRAGQSA